MMVLAEKRQYPVRGSISEHNSDTIQNFHHIRTTISDITELCDIGIDVHKTGVDEDE